MIDKQKIFQLNPMFRLQFEQAQDCYVLLFPEGMIKLNTSASEILTLIDGQRSVQDIIDTLMAKFPDAGDLSVDVNDFLQTAIEKKWLFHD